MRWCWRCLTWSYILIKKPLGMYPFMGCLMRFLESRRLAAEKWGRLEAVVDCAGRLGLLLARSSDLIPEWGGSSLPHVSHIYSAFLSCLHVSRNRFPFLLIQLETRQALRAYEWECFASCLKFSAISPSNGAPCPLLSCPSWLFNFSPFLLTSLP